jgi:para-nitrobenzyl esterase
MAFAATPSKTAGCHADSSTVVCVDGGAVQGVKQGATLAFKGIPYAQPPVGPLRWKPPVTDVHWNGVRDGSQYGAMCPQVVNGKVEGSEDCLFINVWRPEEKPKHPLPVMIWLTGGGNHQYSGAGSPGFGGVVYNGEKLVPEGVVVVTYNPRLNALGFLAHPAFDAERPEKISGNYGSLDQVAMLKWVRKNISAFGGDPERVFLFGASAGGGNICALITSPQTRGLIHGAAMESSVPSGCEIPTLQDVENDTGKRVVHAVGCDTASDVAACMRSKSAEEIVGAIPGQFTVTPRTYGPNLDGHLFKEEPIKVITEKKTPAMPIIIGNTTGETIAWADTAGKVTDQASYEAAIDRVFGAKSRDKILTVYPAKNYASPRAAFAQVTTDAEFTCQSHRVALAFAKAHKNPVFRYVFNYSLDNDPAVKAVGVAHTIEHAFLFNWQGKYKPSESDLTVQRYMVGYWSRMAKDGNPNGAGAPKWQSVSPGQDGYLEISANPQMKAAADYGHCDFWDTIPFVWPHM